MTTFKFIDKNNFDTNLEAFLDHMAAEDSKMAVILKAHVSKIKDAIDDTGRRAARTDFNKSVKSDLDTLLTATKEEANG